MSDKSNDANTSGSVSQFGSRWGFILSAVGSAVGMANVWGFPAKLGQNGGGAFLFAYAVFIIIFAYVGLSTEYAVGRRAKTGTLGAYEKAWISGGKTAVSKFPGWLPLIGSLCIAIGYACIISYVFKAFWDSINGTLMSTDAGTWFNNFAANENNQYSVVAFHIVVVVVTLLTLFLGAKSIEMSNKIMMPIFFLIFIVLAIRVALLPNAMSGYKFIFSPDWSQLANPWCWIWAMGQAFFSLSLTGSGMIVYGAYLKDSENCVSVSIQTAICDSIAAIVATLVMIPACFAYGLDVDAGPSLLFVTLPTILKNIPMGVLFAVILYIAMIFAGISSLQNMFEVIVESIMYRFPKLNRKVTMAVLCILCLGIGINMEPIYKWGPWMDIVSIYIIPIGATLGAVSWFWIMKKEDLLDEINKGTKKPFGTLWHNVGKFVYVPLALILCLIALFMKIPF